MKYVLILGAKSDIARACAARFAREGYNLYLAGRNIRELEDFKKDLELRWGCEVKLLEFDVLKTEKHKEFYESIDPKPCGVLCAIGYLGHQELAEKDFQEAKKIIDTNYTTLVSILHVIAEQFESRMEGFIIGISSVAGDRGRKSNYVYGSAKAGFTTFLSGLRNRLSSKTVKVITVKPGFVRTKMTEELNLPDVLTVEPEKVADDIFNALNSGKDIVYTPWYWKFIMLVVKLIPEKIFKRLDL